MNQQALCAIEGGVIQHAAMIEEFECVATFSLLGSADQLLDRFHHLALINRFNFEYRQIG